MQRAEQLFNLIYEELNSIELPKGARFRLEIVLSNGTRAGKRIKLEVYNSYDKLIRSVAFDEFMPYDQLGASIRQVVDDIEDMLSGEFDLIGKTAVLGRL